jgi:hypothetical protein
VTFSTTLQQFWDAAIARGLFPLAIARGSKAPIGEGWNQWTNPIRYVRASKSRWSGLPMTHDFLPSRHFQQE